MSFLHGRYANASALLLAILFFVISLLIIYIPVLQHTGGVVAYPLDDAYIHLAVAKNLAINHVWGISHQEFTSCSSSILYPILLAGIFMITGPHVAIPLLLNILAGIVFLAFLQKWLIKQSVTPLQQLLVMVIIIVLVPLAPLVQCGMEHTLQLLIYFLFVYSFADALEQQDKPFPWKIYIYGALFTAIRYESMAIILVVCLLLVFYRKWTAALLLGTIGFLPVVLFGVYSISMGNDFFPNSVLVKSSMPPLTVNGIYNFVTEDLVLRLFTGGQLNQYSTQRLLFLIPLIYLLFYEQINQKPAYRFTMIIMMAASFVHIALMLYAGTPRYEAALVGNSMIICSTLLIKYTNWSINKPFSGPGWLKVLLGCFVAFPLFYRGWHANDRASTAAISIYDQQVQMGRFVRQYFDHERIAVNDIGAVSYFGNGYYLDLWGLGSVEVARSMRKHYYTPHFLDSLSRIHQIKIAIVFDGPFHPLLKKWTKIASWTIPNNNASFSETVFFYAVDPAEAPRLASNLVQFQPALPAGVKVAYY